MMNARRAPQGVRWAGEQARIQEHSGSVVPPATTRGSELIHSVHLQFDPFGGLAQGRKIGLLVEPRERAAIDNAPTTDRPR